MKTERIGEWAFILGVLLAILAGLFLGPEGWVAALLVALGAVVGLLNVSERETTPFLVASVALLLAGSAGLETLPLIGTFLAPILSNLVAFVAPAAVIVAIKAVYDLARKR
jgi:hypothetical protein